MERIMNILTKITSIIIILLAIYGIHLGISFVELYLDSSPVIQDALLNTTIYFVLSIIFSVFFMLVFYSPFIYYGWVKNPSNQDMKSFTKLMTIGYTICVVFVSPIFNGIDFLYIPGTLLALILIIPLYYYAWR